jgi:hypothetical protein
MIDPTSSIVVAHFNSHISNDNIRDTSLSVFLQEGLFEFNNNAEGELEYSNDFDFSACNSVLKMMRYLFSSDYEFVTQHWPEISVHMIPKIIQTITAVIRELNHLNCD